MGERKKKELRLQGIQQQELRELLTPVMTWLRKNLKPSAFVLVDGTHAEVLENTEAEPEKEG